MKKVCFRRGKASLAAFMVTLFCVGASAVALPVGKKDSSADLLQKWYKEYKITGNTDSVAVTDVGDEFVEQASANLGGLLYSSLGYKNTSTGYRAVYNTGGIGYRAYKNFGGNRVNGFVTALHVFDGAINSNAYLYRNGQYVKFGRVDAKSSAIDTAFVSVASGNSLNTRTPSGKSITAKVATIKRDQKVTMHGALSGEKSSEVYLPNEGGCVWTKSIISVRGDSGSVVYTNVNGQNQIVGIVKGISSSSTVITKAATINSKLGVTPY